MNTKELRSRKEKLKLTQRQRDIIVGLLLGDGHLETQNGGRTYRLKVEHASAQSDYVHWLFEELREWIPALTPYVKTRKNGEVNVGFCTYAHGVLRFYAQQFYDGKRKMMPARIERMFAPIGLAVWFMDDGSRKSAKHHTYIIHTLGYTRAELLKVQVALGKKFLLHTDLHRQKGRYWRLYIPARFARTFERIIGKYVTPFPSMKHKLVTHA